MSGLTILNGENASDTARWLSLWHTWPEREVFAHPEYVKLYAGEGASAHCATFNSGSVSVLFPFLVRDLTGERFWNGTQRAYDITSPYGYSGPFTWGEGDRSALARTFWEAYRSWASEQNIAADFVRFSLFNESILHYPGSIWSASDHIVRSLVGDESAMWMDFEHKVRKNVNKALRSQVRVETDLSGQYLSEFINIYQQTMDRRAAQSPYYFPVRYFTRICESLKGQFVFFHAVLRGTVISTELVLVSETAVYSFLGGTSKEAFPYRPNDLLKIEVMKWARANGKRNYVLGGGYEPEDGIFRYKLAFAPSGRVPYRLGGQILSPALYSELVDNRKRLDAPCVPRRANTPAFFPEYRA